MVPASLPPGSGVSHPKDFTRALPFQLAMAILGLLDQKSLDACSAVNGHWEFLVRRAREDKECRSTVQKDLLQLQELCPRKTMPSYAKRVDVQIPQLNDEGEVIEVKDKEQKKRRKSKTEDFSLHEAYRELKTDKIELEERNVFCGPYKTCVLLEQCWNIHSGACVRTFTGHYATVTCLHSHQERVVSGAGDGMVKVWSLKSGKCLRTLMHSSPVWAVRMDGTHVVSGGHRGLVKVWSAETGALIKTLERHQGPVLCLSFDQWHLVTGSSDGYALGWSMLGKFRRCLIAFFHPKEVLSLEFLYLRVVSGCADGCIRIFSFLTGTCLKVLEPAGSGDPVSALCVAGNRVVTNSPSRLLLLQFEEVAWDYSVPADREVPKHDKRWQKGKRQGAGAEQQRAQGKSPKTRQGPKSHGRPKDEEAEQGPASPAAEEAEATWECELPHRDPRCPMSPDKFLLTIGRLQSFCRPAAGSRSPSVLSARARAAQQQQQRPGDAAMPRAPLQHREERAAQLQRARLHSRSLTATKTSTPFETKMLRLRLKNSLHSPAVKSSIPAPCVVRPTVCGSLGERKTPSGHGKDTRGPKDGHQLIDLCRAAAELIQPAPGPAAEMRNEAARRIKPSCPYASRRDSGLRLLTAEQELREAAAAAQRQAQQAKPAEDNDRARRKAWLRKTKGLPVDSFTGERKTPAPELGRNTFI
ncbi:F-box/WD repeat-containing protein 10-like isoform X4 [Motacilla alba alba]|uniref:F-box/WD repeat-containing protein 10-like isoform X4 n=1 Tax=Motacilla alba alba TaxID=1094192 RepID=UPI0018D574ED|nr:F-box/WD repeat-containing protein 10-like isoform X4 [Motacilla alba alba]